VYQQGSLLATTATPSFVVTGLSPQITYSFTVAAKDEYGVSSQSLPLSVTTLTTGTPVGNYTISITGKDGNGEVQNGAGATVSVQVSQP
jgi:chitodextrinase